MVAPTKSFTPVADADIDPDSPLTTGLVTALRDRDENLSSQLIGETSPFTAAQKHDHDGVNSALLAGTFQLVQTQTVSGGAVQTVTFSGLDGNTDIRYFLFGRTRSAGASGTIVLRPNGAASTFSSRALIFDGTTTVIAATNTTGLLMYREVTPGGNQGTFQFVLHAEVTTSPAFNRHGYGQFQVRSESAAAANGGTTAGEWDETTTNITSLDIRHSAAGGIDNNSVFSLFRLKKT